MNGFKFANSYVSLERAGVELGVTVDDLIHAGAFNQVQICMNVYARAEGISMHRIDTAIDSSYTDIDADSREEAQAHDRIFREWIDRLKINVMPAGIYEVTQDDLRLFEMPENESIEVGNAFKSDDRGLWEIEFDPLVQAARTDFMMLATEIERIKKRGEISATSIHKPLGTRERDTLLTIIAVLCKEAKLDYTKAAKTAGLIRSTAATMDVSIGETTIEGHLKKIPNALGTHTK